MTKFPHLAEMGVENPQQIDNYSVNSIAYTDILRIVYARPKGSLLPASKTFKFPRIQETVESPGKGQGEVTMKSNPAFRSAVGELQEILESRQKDQDVAAAIIEELRLLEEDIAMRSQCIKTLLGKT